MPDQRMSSHNDPLWPQSAWSISLKHLMFLMLLITIPVAAMTHSSFLSRVALLLFAPTASIVFGVIVQERKEFNTILRVVFCMGFGIGCYTLGINLLAWVMFESEFGLISFPGVFVSVFISMVGAMLGFLGLT